MNYDSGSVVVGPAMSWREQRKTNRIVRVRVEIERHVVVVVVAVGLEPTFLGFVWV